MRPDVDLGAVVVEVWSVKLPGPVSGSPSLLMTQVNQRIHTESHRYPLLFGNLDLMRRRLLGAKVRILSFGCSTGEELMSLAAYFPDDELFGCDVNEGALDKAREVANLLPNCTVFYSDLENLERHGPYDLIFANSVLCINTASEKKLKEEFPFSRFETMALMLARLLSDSGILALYNTSYFPSDSDALLELLRPIRSHFVVPGYVPMFDRDSRLELARRVEGRRCYYERLKADSRPFAAYFDFLFTRSEAVAGFKLDYSAMPLFEDGDVVFKAQAMPAKRGLIVNKPVLHYRDGMKAAELWGIQSLHRHRLMLGEGFLFQMFYRVPGSPLGLASTSAY